MSTNPEATVESAGAAAQVTIPTATSSPYWAPPQHVESVWLADAPADAVDRVVGLIGDPRVRAVVRFVIGAVIAFYVIQLGCLVSFVRPSRRFVFRVFNLLPWLLLGEYAPIVGIVAPDQDGSRPRWLWFILVGWWAGILWASMAWMALLGVVTAPAAMWMLASLDRVLFLPYVPVVRPAEPSPLPEPPRRPPAPILALVPDICEPPASDSAPEADPAESIVEPRFERVAIGKKLRFRVFARDGFRCQYCGRPAGDGVILHVDHRVPVARGGTNDESNLATACSDCNLGKGVLELASSDVA